MLIDNNNQLSSDIKITISKMLGTVIKFINRFQQIINKSYLIAIKQKIIKHNGERFMITNVLVLEDKVKRTFKELTGSGLFPALFGNNEHVFDYLDSERMLTEALIKNDLQQLADKLREQNQSYEGSASSNSSSVGSSSGGSADSRYKSDVVIRLFDKEMVTLRETLKECFVKCERKDFFPELIPEDQTDNLIRGIDAGTKVDLCSVALVLKSECKRLTRSGWASSKERHTKNIERLVAYIKGQIKEQRLKCMEAQFNEKMFVFILGFSGRGLLAASQFGESVRDFDMASTGTITPVRRNLSLKSKEKEDGEESVADVAEGGLLTQKAMFEKEHKRRTWIEKESNNDFELLKIREKQSRLSLQ